MITSVRNHSLFLFSTVILFLLSLESPAIPLYDHTGWKISVGGFVDLKSIYDTTRSYTEVPYNGPVIQGLSVATAAQGGSINGDTPRFQESARNSRLRVFAEAPEFEGWKATGYFEGDFLGFEPTIPGAAPSPESEQNAYASGTFRMRLAQVELTKDDWRFLVGQGWNLFGWQNYYQLSNLVNSSSINVSLRTPELIVQRNVQFRDNLKLEVAVSATKPDQRDSAIPNMNAGVNLSWTGRQTAYLHNAHNHVATVPTSIEISGMMNQFSTPNTDGYDPDRTGYTGGGFAASALIPVITGDEKDPRNSLSLVGEFVRGTGLANQYNSFNGGFGAASSAYATGTTAATQFNPNLDAGFGAWDNTGTFQLIQTQEWTAQLQYFLPVNAEVNIDLEYGHLQAVNVYNLFNTYVAAGQTAAAQATFDYVEFYAANIYYALTKDIKLAGEYDRFLTHYIDGNYPVNNRLQFTVYYMF